MILMPWPNGGAGVTATEQACGTQIVQTTGGGVETTCFSDSVAQYSNGTNAKIL